MRAARATAGLSQIGCAELVYVSRRAWQTYEDGTVPIKRALWELFLWKTGQMLIVPLQFKPQRQTPPTRRTGRAENLKPFTARKAKEQ